EAGMSEFAPQIASARDALPVPLQGSASYAVNPANGALRLTVTANPALFQGVTDIRFFPLTWGPVSNSAAQRWAISGGELTLDLRQGDSKETPEKLEGLLVLTKGSGEGTRKGYTIAAARGPDTASAGGLFDGTGPAGALNSGQQNAAADGISGSVG